MEVPVEVMRMGREREVELASVPPAPGATVVVVVAEAPALVEGLLLVLLLLCCELLEVVQGWTYGVRVVYVVLHVGVKELFAEFVVQTLDVVGGSLGAGYEVGTCDVLSMR